MVPRYESDRVIAELPVQSARRGRIAGLSSQVEVPATTCEQEEQEYTGVSAMSTASRELWSVLSS